MYFASKSYFPPEGRVDTTISHFVNYESAIQLPLMTSLTYEPLTNRNLIGSKSKQILNSKVLAIGEHNHNIQDKQIQTTRSGRKVNRKYSDNNNYQKNGILPITDFSKLNNQSNQLYSRLQQKPLFSQSMKTSAIDADGQENKCTKTNKKQNQFKPFEYIKEKKINHQRSISKEGFNIRESLGTLSQQIKNTLKYTHQKQIQKQNNTKSSNQLNMSPSRPNKNNGSTDQSYTRYQKTPSFFISPQTTKSKKPKFLESKYKRIESQNEIYSDKQNKDFEQKAAVTSRFYQPHETKQKHSFLRSSVNPSIASTKDNELQYRCLVSPVTPQLRTSKKYDSYNYQKLRKKYQSSNFKPQNPSVSTSVRSPSSYGSPKSSFLHKSSGLQSNSSGGSRYSLNSNERSSFGREITLNDFHLGNLKGEGRFGKFYPAIHKRTGLLVGIKQIKKEFMKNMLDQFIQQLKIQSFIQHPNVVKLYGYFATKENFYLIMEYMEEGSLFSFIKKIKKLHQEEASTKLKQVCSAVEYLHENQIIHRDIKPQNIVMTCDVCKLCDFGWAVYTNTRRKTYCGTLDYVCPQILQGETYDSCVDIWAIGVLAYEMLVGKAPFYNISRKQTMKKIMECNFQLPKQLSIVAKSFISKALNKNPEQRETMQNLIRHQFLNL